MPLFVLPAQWPAPPRIHALTTLRHGLGVSPAPFDSLNLGNRSSPQGDLLANVERNRALLTQGLGLPGAPHWLRQVHGVEVVRVDAPRAVDAAHAQLRELDEPVADAAVTSVPGVVLAILTADCLRWCWPPPMAAKWRPRMRAGAGWPTACWNAAWPQCGPRRHSWSPGWGRPQGRRRTKLARMSSRRL